MADYTGRTLGKYQLQERLGRGGMAEVYKAYQRGLDRFVAVKILHPHLSDTPDFVGRFKREAQAIAQLHHPHIVQVFDFDAQDELYYMIMEYVAGASLKTRLDELFARGERLPLADVMRLFQALLDAVGYAHAHGMVHRDLKPANVLLEKAADGSAIVRPVLTDFGIAKIVGAAKFTETGVSVGTPHYMSPEQGQGESGDVRSDLYALGVVLFECLAGQVPFDGETSVAVLLKHISAPIPSLLERRPELPPALEAIVRTALAKEPADRYQSAADMWAALAQLKFDAEVTTQIAVGRPALSGPPARAAAAPRPPRPRLPRWLVLALVFVVSIGLGLAGVYGAVRLFNPPPMASARATASAESAAGNYQLAADGYSAILAAAPNDVPALLGRAAAYEALGQMSDALADVGQALTADPANATAYEERARLSLQYGLADDPAAALADLDRAIELAPDAHAYFLRGWALLNFPLTDGARSPQAALPDLLKAAALDAANAETQFTLAQTYLLLARPFDGLAAANRAIELSPRAAVYYLLRAHLQFSLNDSHAASDDLSMALGLETAPAAQAALLLERGFLNHALGEAAAARADLERAASLDSTAMLIPFLRAVLDPAAPRPAPADFTLAAGAAPDDPIWQALVAQAAG
jgi:serine/threonine-protein kinase